MTTQRTNAFLRPTLLAVGAMMASLVGSQPTATAQDFPIWFGEGVVLEATDLYDEGISSQSLKVTYYDAIDTESLGDDEIWVVSPNGFNGFAVLERFEELPVDIPLFDPNIIGIDLHNANGDPLFPWLGRPAIVAHYTLKAPDGNTWNASNNGSYSVLVAPGSVGLAGGGHVGHQLLGTFGVRIGETSPVQVEDWSVSVIETTNGCAGNVRLRFASRTEVDWGEVMRDGERLFVRIEAKTSSDGGLAHGHTYPFGDLPPGAYLFEVRVNDRLLDIAEFEKRNEPGRVPAEVAVQVEQGAAQPPVANVHIQFLEPGWMITSAGEVKRRGNRFFVDAIARKISDVPEAEPWQMSYDLPYPEPGIYSFTFCLNGQVCDSTRFEIGDPSGDVSVQSIDVAFTGAVACPEGEIDPATGEVDGGLCFYEHVAGVTIRHSDHLAVVNWGEPIKQDDGNTILIDIETAPVPVPPDTADGTWTSAHRYDLGLLEEGPWEIVFTHAGKRIGRKEFHSPAAPEVEVTLRTTGLDPDATRHVFQVIYSGATPIDVESLGNDEIKVTNPILYVIDLAGPIPPCLQQFAKLVDYDLAADGHSIAARYAIECNDADWPMWGGPNVSDGLDVHLVESGVQTTNGIDVPGQYLGIIPFGGSGNDVFRLDAHADVPPIHLPVDTAELNVHYHSNSAIDTESLSDGDIAILEGHRIHPDGTVTTLKKPIYATLHNFTTSDNGKHIEAIYHIAPSDGWTSAANGEYTLTLVRGALTNEEGKTHAAMDIGHLLVDIEPDLVVGDAMLSLRREGGKIMADVTTLLQTHTVTDWGTAELRGHVFHLDASARPTPADARQKHSYQLLPLGEDEPIEFEPIPEDALGPALLAKPANIVIRNEAEWEEFIHANWDPSLDADMPPAPVDFSDQMLVGVALGGQPLGFNVQISSIVISAPGNLVVNYDEILPGVAPPEDVVTYPLAIVSIPQIDLPVVFVKNVIALPGPAPDVPENADDNGILPGDGDPLPAPPEEELESANLYWVVFSVNGQPLARKQFYLPPSGDGILAHAWIDIDYRPNGVGAQVNVQFPGYPYHQIVDWAEARQVGNTFYLPAKAEQVEFIVDPGLVEQDHYYKLVGSSGGGGNGESIPFEPLGLENWFALKPANLVIQTADEWAAAWGNLSPLDSLPPEPPVNFDTHTILAVLQGQKPNGCYAVEINEVTQDANGAITIHYVATVPSDGQACPEVITHPQSFVAIPKAKGPFTFSGTETTTDVLEPNGENFRIILPWPDRYQVLFLINDVVYARTEFAWRGPLPEPRPSFDVNLRAEAGENEAKVHATLMSPDGLISNVAWEEPTVNGRSILANVSLDFTPWDQLLNIDPPTPEPVEHTYSLDGLRPGLNVFKLSVNGQHVAHTFFAVRGPEGERPPFERWLEELLAQVPNAVEEGLADALGDLDGDGSPDIGEFFLGTNPLKDDIPFIRPEWISSEDGSEHLGICFHRRKDTAGIEATVQASRNLHDWAHAPEWFKTIRVTDIGNGMEEVVISLREAATQSEFQFLRLYFEAAAAATSE